MAREQNQKLVSFFDGGTNRFYRLFLPSENDWPCLEISGVRMHCVENGIKENAIAMANALKPLKGKILDACTGLGYTAILMAKENTVEKVFSFELDSNVLKIAKENPFSKGLFENPKIVLETKDVSLAIKDFQENFFDRILLDPPSFSLAGELYGQKFYSELFRVLKPKGIFFHYTGNPGEKKGRDFQQGVIRRLQQAGFSKIEKAFGGKGLRVIK